MFIYFNNANGQLISWTMSGNTNISGSILGTTTGNFPLEIKNGASYPINFYTNGSQRATILAGGNVGINNTAPDNLFEVKSGDIDVETSTNGYMINDDHVLRHKGDANNIFTGVYAGQYNSSGTGNTFTGYAAGQYNSTGSDNTISGWGASANNTTGSRNSCYGSNSGLSLTTYSDNTFIGYSSGKVNAAVENTFIGSYSGQANTSGTSNTASGFKALYANTTGGKNTAVGWKAGAANTTASDNTFVGYNSGAAATGIKNTFVGSESGQANTTGKWNTAIGPQALYSNTTGHSNIAIGSAALLTYPPLYLNTTGEENIAIGAGALTTCDTGNGNVAVGHHSLYTANTNYCTAVGYKALYYNTAGENVAVGLKALYENSTGEWNTAVGSFALQANTTGIRNVAFGYVTLAANDDGDYNCAFGMHALLANNSGNNNVSLGYKSLVSNTSGSNNTALGYQAGYDGTTHSQCNFIGASSTLTTVRTNVTLLGYGIVNGQCTGNNQVCLGNTAVVSPGLRSQQTGITAYSDARYKTNIKENVSGLDFILKLKPVTYNVRPTELHKIWGTPDSIVSKIDHSEAEKEIRIGFVAQEVEKAAKESGFNFPGIDVPRNEQEVYTLRYVDFIMPMVKAIQELSATVDSLKNELATTSTPQLEGQKQTATSISINSTARDLPVLAQNQPNPFNESTLLRFYLPKGTRGASIKVYDINGSVYRLFALTGEGPGNVAIEANTLNSGNYFYSLIIDGSVVDTKTMAITK